MPVIFYDTILFYEIMYYIMFAVTLNKNSIKLTF